MPFPADGPSGRRGLRDPGRACPPRQRHRAPPRIWHGGPGRAAELRMGAWPLALALVGAPSRTEGNRGRGDLPETASGPVSLEHFSSSSSYEFGFQSLQDQNPRGVLGLTTGSTKDLTGSINRAILGGCRCGEWGSLGRRRGKPRSAAVAAAGCRALRQVGAPSRVVVEMRSIKLRLVTQVRRKE